MIWSISVVILSVFVCVWIIYKTIPWYKIIFQIRKSLRENKEDKVLIEKKSNGVASIGAFAVFFSSLFLIVYLLDEFQYGLEKVSFSTSEVKTMTVLLSLLIFGIGILRLKSWARWGIIVWSIYGIFDTVSKSEYIFSIIREQKIVDGGVALFFLLLFIFLIYFFTHPKVKAQFR